MEDLSLYPPFLKEFLEKEFLESEDLLQISLAETIFLVDGNNLMQKQKIFRFYFDSLEEEKKSL